MQIVDIRVEEDHEADMEAGTAMQNVTFRSDEGDTVTVRLRGSGNPADRPGLVERAKALLQHASSTRTENPLPADVAAGLPDATGSEVEGRLSLDENSDNAYQGSDDALPDDDLEKTLSRDPGREGSRFDEM